jgi:hypothetical protein
MVGGYLWVLRLLSPLKTGRHDIAERGVKYNKLINQFINICYKKKKKKNIKELQKSEKETKLISQDRNT